MPFFPPQPWRRYGPLLLALALLAGCRAQRVALEFEPAARLFPTPVAPAGFSSDGLPANSTALPALTARAARRAPAAARELSGRDAPGGKVPAPTTSRPATTATLPGTPAYHKSLLPKRRQAMQKLANTAPARPHGWLEGLLFFLAGYAFVAVVFGYIVSGLFKLSFLTGVWYVVLGFAAFIVGLLVLALAGVLFYQLYRRIRPKKTE